METKIDSKRMERIRRRSGFVSGIDVGAEGSRGGLCLAWREDVKVSLKTFSEHHIDVLVEDNNVQGKWRYTSFYGSPYANAQADSWRLLRVLGQEQQGSWLVSGDFNEILYSHEKSGGQMREERKMIAFREALEDCNLMDLGFQGTWFTWERGNLAETNIRERLDRGWLMNNGCRSLPSFDSYGKGGSAWWTLEESFEEEIKKSWEISTGTISEKLESLQHWLLRWARHIKYDRDKTKKELTKELGILLDGERNDDTLAKIIETRIHLNMEIDKYEMYWEQRAKANWLKLGDRNSAFFHKYALTRRRINSINRLETEKGQEVSDDSEIGDIAYRYFQKLFTSSGVGDSSHILAGITHSISSDINEFLQSPYSVDEVQKALKGMGPTKAPVAKTIANRLEEFIGQCIDSAQSAFVPRRLISDNMLIAYEILHTLRQKRVGKKGFMAVKLDMSKAYDRVEWSYLQQVMLRIGFAEGWVSLVMKCISTVSYTVNINGNRGRLFYPTRGLRQGDPLSPYLFLICSEGLSALIRQAVGAGTFRGVKASRRGPEISHLLFADDSLLFGEATKERAIFLKEILKQYEQSLGQCVNFNKSTIFFSWNTLDEVKQEISNVLGMRQSNNIERYLGLPNVVGRKKRESFQNLKDKITQRIGQWSTRYLSQGGKEVFIKSVLQSIPTYAMMCFLLPKTFCGELESLFAKWWQHGKNKMGIHWCKWSFLCRAKEDGGLGFRDMSKFNISLLAKQGWRLMTNVDSLVARVLKAKYYPHYQFLNSRLRNTSSILGKAYGPQKIF
ncbi:reverse transcriptase [Gossypium australe]|uniref:Reverse transcriptase n=1 Tax=Gossypium australe TaxID=47621 RepID=A0A5B6WBV5_9ROSI|nr:reverse transcriptase [Gossypium australe]